MGKNLGFGAEAFKKKSELALIPIDRGAKGEVDKEYRKKIN